MKVINVGDRYETYSDAMKVYDKLPAQSYIIQFSDMTGFSLLRHSDISANGEKAYGIHNEKAAKVLKSFQRSQKNLGVILSGKKGIGKSFFAKILCSLAQEQGIPTILVDRYIPGISNFIESIEQEVLVMFDEFDKTFGSVKQGENSAEAQTEMLGLFDGMSTGKKLFVITCNNIDRLSDYLINRPGRFHYHFQFNYPAEEEIIEYMEDNLSKEFHHEIKEIVKFSKKVNLNYDCLRAIAFELESGISFKECISDLNIVNTEWAAYNVELKLTNGETVRKDDIRLDMFNANGNSTIFLMDDKGRDIIDAVFKAEDIIYDNEKGAYTVDKKKILVYADSDYDHMDDYKNFQDAKPASDLIIKLSKPKSIHYMV